jgi:hypothetical protein
MLLKGAQVIDSDRLAPDGLSERKGSILHLIERAEEAPGLRVNGSSP